MTKVMMHINKAGDIMFDCQNHADDHDACTVISTLCNVMVQRTIDLDREPTIYNKGHVRIDIPNADQVTQAVFQTVYTVMEQAARQQPEYIRTY